MSPFQVPAIYHEHQYLEPPSNASSNGSPIASCDAVLVDHGFTQAHDYGQYPSLHGVEGYSMHSHPGYEGDHLIQEQVYGPPRSEYYSHYQPDEPPVPAHGYTIRQGSGTADPISPISIRISESFDGTFDVTGVSAPQVALACSGPEPLQKFASGEPGSHRWHYVNQDQHVGNINNVWFSAPTSLSASERSGPQEPVDSITRPDNFAGEPWFRAAATGSSR
ncbi:hypothetical protein BDN67DRAFT_1069371 [Paxillus ammoniavirescens]|nr:hypothetical protein BDN67DRAFT_1069371 [Paxillus ammoniavirescens]